MDAWQACFWKHQQHHSEQGLSRQIVCTFFRLLLTNQQPQGYQKLSVDIFETVTSQSYQDGHDRYDVILQDDHIHPLLRLLQLHDFWS